MKFLKSLPANRRAYNDFEWPAEAGAIVEAPDWNPKPACGGGLHGLVDGRGDVGLLCKDADAIWYAFESVSSAGEPSDAEAVVINGDKGKCRRAMIRVVGTREAAVQWLVAKGCTGVHFSTATAGDRGTATAGYGGTATAGDGGTATAGHGGTATAGYGGTATAGHGGTATAGHGGTATAGGGGTATAGDRGTATAGDRGTATAGDRGTATAGYGGTATAGDRGTATAGYGGTATAGMGGTLILCRWDEKRYKYSVAEVGENGIKPGIAYRLNADGLFVEAMNLLG